MKYSFFFDAKHFESERESVSSCVFLTMAITVGCWLFRHVMCVIIQSVCFGVWSSSGAAQKSCPGMLLTVLYMKGVEAETWWVWAVVVLDTDLNGTHGHNEKRKNTLEDLSLFSFSN